MKGTPVFGVVMLSFSTRRSKTVVWIPGDRSGSAKLRRGREEFGDVAGFVIVMPGCREVEGPLPRRWGAGRGRGWTRSSSSGS